MMPPRSLPAGAMLASLPSSWELDHPQGPEVLVSPAPRSGWPHPQELLAPKQCALLWPLPPELLLAEPEC